MIQLSISQLLIIIIFIILLFVLYSFYHIRKGFLFFRHVLETNQQQLINQQKQIDHHEQILQALTGISSPSFSSQNLTQDISNSMTTPSHPSQSSSNHFNLPSGIMGNIFHLINNVASTPPNPENIIEQEMKEYIKESSIEKELESELNELKDSTNNSSINEGRLDELSISSQNSDSSSSNSIH